MSPRARKQSPPAPSPVPSPVDRVQELEQTLRSVLALVQANAESLGERQCVPGAALQGLALQVQALGREVLP